MKESVEIHSFVDTKILMISGGKGTRLSPLLEEIPKPMIKIGNYPLLEHLLMHSTKYGFKKFIFKTGYLAEKIEQYFGDGEAYNCKIEYFREKELLGTCGGLNYLKDEKKPIIVIYGDTLVNINLVKILKYHYYHDAQVTLAVHESDHPEDSDIIIKNDKDRVMDLIHKPGTKQFGNTSNAALYVMNPECFSEIPESGVYDFAKNLIPKLIKKDYRVFAYSTDEYIKDVGTVKRYKEVIKDYSSRKIFNRVQAVFLDRDGVINEENGLIYKKEDLVLIPDAEQSIGLLNDTGIPAIVITNQPVIAKNLCTLKELKQIHSYLCSLLNEKGAYLNSIYFCPHHPDKGYPEERAEYKYKCQCRKPEIGLLKEAAVDNKLDLNQSFFIGDTTTDIKAGKKAGCRTILVKTGFGGLDKKYSIYPDYIFQNLLTAIRFIVKYNDSTLDRIILSIKEKLLIKKELVLLVDDKYSTKGKYLIDKVEQSFQNHVYSINLEDFSVEKQQSSEKHIDNIVESESRKRIILSSLSNKEDIVIVRGHGVFSNSNLFHLADIKIHIDLAKEMPYIMKKDYKKIEEDTQDMCKADFIY